MKAISGTWKKIIDKDVLRRSSQVISAIGNQIFVYGGELKPREPVDNDIHVLEVSDKGKL
jgi:hypothetical protein